jgi:hypothetical protein
MTNKKFQISIFHLSFLVLSVSFSIASAATSNLSGYAWSSNIGWIKFSGSNYGVSINELNNQLSGYGWSSNIGWVKFDPTLPAGLPAGQWARACAGAADSANCGGLINLAAGGWDGWLKLRDGFYGINRSNNGCNLEGWAWGGDVVGWIHFNGLGYGVGLQSCSEPVVDIPTLPNCAFAAVPAQVSINGIANLVWNCQGTADSCSIPKLGINNANQSGNVLTGRLAKSIDYELICRNMAGENRYFTKVTVLRPAFCEVIPFLGTCK